MYGVFPKRMELSYLQQDDTSVWAYCTSLCHYLCHVGTAMALSLLRFKCKNNYLTVIQGTGPTAVRFQNHYTAIA